MASKVSQTVTVTPVERPARKLILKRSRAATDYLSFCGEVGCEWHTLHNYLAGAMDTAALLMLPKEMVKADTSAVACGVEVPADYADPIPEGYESIDLPPCTMLYFQGMPFENGEDYGEAIAVVFEAAAHYQPERYGYRFAEETAPAFHFGADAKSGARYALPVKRIGVE